MTTRTRRTYAELAQIAEAVTFDELERLFAASGDTIIYQARRQPKQCTNAHVCGRYANGNASVAFGHYDRQRQQTVVDVITLGPSQPTVVFALANGRIVAA